MSSTLLANILNLLIHIPNTFPVTSLFLERSESNRISLSLKFFLLLDFHALLSESKGISGYRKYCCFCITCKIAFLLSIGSCHGGGRPNVLKHTIIDIAKLLFLLQHRKSIMIVNKCKYCVVSFGYCSILISFFSDK